MSLAKEYALAVRESLPDLDESRLNRQRNDGKYYEDEYAEPIKRYFSERGVSSLETRYSARWKCTPVCAIASSARLCFLYFGKNSEAAFEKGLKNDLKHPSTTKMDAAVGESFCECKCQEILSTSHAPLNERYLDSKLFGEFGVKKYTLKPMVSTDGETIRAWRALQFDVAELGIEYEKPVDYTRLHLDLKQMICHLIAIAKECKGKPAVLQYVFFTPNRALIKKYPKVDALYEELKLEWSAVTAHDTAISEFARTHKITIAKPKYVEIGSVEDFLLNP